MAVNGFGVKDAVVQNVGGRQGAEAVGREGPKEKEAEQKLKQKQAEEMNE